MFEYHEDLKDGQDRIKFLQDSYNGGDDYRQGEYLEAHDNENSGKEGDKYKKRLRLANFTNLCAPVVDGYNAYLYKEQPDRDYGNLQGETFQAFHDNADLMGRSYPKFIQEISKHSGALGYYGVIVDKPQGEAASKGEELANGIRPYLAAYHPSAIVYYRFETIGTGRVLVELVLIEETTPEYTLYKVWHLDKWETFKQKAQKEPEIDDEGENPLGRIPFTIIRNKDKFHPVKGVSDISDIADSNNRLYQIDSSALEVILNTGFPFFEYPMSKADAVKTIGTTNALPREDEDTTGYRWIEPAHTSLANIRIWRQDIIDDIKQASKIGQSETKAVESGAALEIRFQGLNAILAEKADNMELSENSILTFVALWMGLKWTGKVKYTREFGVEDLATIIETSIMAKAAVPSREFHRLLHEKIVNKMAKYATPEEIKKVMDELMAEPEIIPDVDKINGEGRVSE